MNRLWELLKIGSVSNGQSKYFASFSFIYTFAS